MRRSQRLRKRRDFDAVFRKGRSFFHELLALRVRRNDLPHNRFGFVVSKRLGGAVARNRVRRRLREAVRKLTLGDGWDIVLSARPAAANADYHRLAEASRWLLERAGVFSSDGRGPEEGEKKA